MVRWLLTEDLALRELAGPRSPDRQLGGGPARSRCGLRRLRIGRGPFEYGGTQLRQCEMKCLHGMGDDVGDERDKPLWREHFALLVSVGLGGFVVLRLLGVANWDLTTALAIASVSGTATVALNSVLASLPVLYAAALLFFLPTVVAGLARRTKVERSAALTGLTLPLLLLLYIAPLITLLVGLAGMTILWIYAKRAAVSRRKLRAAGKAAPEPESPSRFERFGALTGALLFLLVATVSTPWFPTENLRIGNESTFTGYVIGSRDHDVVVLRDVSRVIVVTPTATLSRTLCSKDDPWAKSAMQFVLRPRYEACLSSDG